MKTSINLYFTQLSCYPIHFYPYTIWTDWFITHFMLTITSPPKFDLTNSFRVELASSSIFTSYLSYIHPNYLFTGIALSYYRVELPLTRLKISTSEKKWEFDLIIWIILNELTFKVELNLKIIFTWTNKT